MKLSFEQQFSILRDFTVLQMDRAADLARGGRKDDAREWVNYFENSRILELLADSELGVVTGAEKARLMKQLQELRGMCHPLDVPDYQSDFAAIRGEISRITRHLGMDAASKFSADMDEKIIQFPGVVT